MKKLKSFSSQLRIYNPGFIFITGTKALSGVNSATKFLIYFYIKTLQKYFQKLFGIVIPSTFYLMTKKKLFN